MLVHGGCATSANIGERSRKRSIGTSLIRDAVDNTDRGLFGLAMQDIYDAGIEEQGWSPGMAVDPTVATELTKQSLRERLEMVKATARPIF